MIRAAVLLIALASIAAALPPPTCVASTMVTDCTPTSATDGCYFCYKFECQTHDVNTWQLCATFCQNRYNPCEYAQTLVTGQTCYISSNCPPNLPYALETDTDQYDYCYNKYCGPSGAQITCNSSCPTGVTLNFSAAPIKPARWRQRLKRGNRPIARS